jgi:acetyl esterase/lipase
VIACAALAWAVLVRGRNPLRFLYATGPLPAERYAALAAKPGWKRWNVTLPDGVVLNGLIRHSTRADAPWILFYPGNDAAQLTTGQRAVDAMIAAEDWGGAVIAYRGFDGSGGEPRIERLLPDGVAIHDALLAAEHLTTAQVHLSAFSIGGNIATYVASQLARRGAPAPSLALMASVHDIVMVRPSLLSRLDPGDALRTAPFLAGVPAPALVVTGAADDALDGTTQAKAIASALGARAQYIELPGVRHAELLVNEAALAAVHTFVSAHQAPTH